MRECTWLPWMTGNNNRDSEHGPAYSCHGLALVGLQVREQAGFGVIDFSVYIREPAGAADEWLPWLTRNRDHDWERPAYLAPANHVLVGLVVKEQGGFGIVDARCLVRPTAGGATVEGPWFCANPSGNELRVECPPAHAITGLQVREQGGFGVIDVRLAHTPLAKIP